MAKGMPWAGAYTNPGKPAEQYTPAGGHPGPSSTTVAGNESVNQFVHESLQGEQHPDQSPKGKRTYG